MKTNTIIMLGAIGLLGYILYQGSDTKARSEAMKSAIDAPARNPWGRPQDVADIASGQYVPGWENSQMMADIVSNIWYD